MSLFSDLYVEALKDFWSNGPLYIVSTPDGEDVHGYIPIMTTMDLVERLLAEPRDARRMLLQLFDDEMVPAEFRIDPGWTWIEFVQEVTCRLLIEQTERDPDVVAESARRRRIAERRAVSDAVTASECGP